MDGADGAIFTRLQRDVEGGGGEGWRARLKHSPSQLCTECVCFEGTNGSGRSVCVGESRWLLFGSGEH